MEMAILFEAGERSKNYYFKDLIMQSLVKHNKLVKPKQKDFKKINKGEPLCDDCLTVKFNEQTRTVSYYTDDNNHSFDMARESFLGKLFFESLDEVKFTAKTGGFLSYLDEYMKKKKKPAKITKAWGNAKTKYIKQIIPDYSEDVPKKLVVSEKIKKYVKEKYGLSCSSSLMEPLAKKMEEVIEKAVSAAKKDKKKTIMPRHLR